ncbi:MAG: anti-sigma factor [Caulobacteraceae bacterium]|nr:anti-sigma factor [Caulobacter sp.]
MADLPPQDPAVSDDLLAAEQALGVLDGAERIAAERRVRDDPVFAAAVEGWSWRLAGLADEAGSRPPPPEVWARIARRLGGEVVELRLRRSLALWRATAAAAMAVAAGLAVALFAPRADHVQTARLTGGQDGRYVYVIVYDPGRRRAVFTAADQPGIAGRTPQLWALPPGGKPISLGIAPDGRVASLVVDPGAAGAGRTLAVSLEPQGGSPTGQPTGPVVATGALRPI